MDHKEIITVVIPCYNEARFIEKVVYDALNVVAVSRVVIVDDHSQDGSFELLQSLAKKDKRIFVAQTPQVLSGYKIGYR